MHLMGGIRRVLGQGAALAMLLFAAAPARADFVGNLQLVPAGCESSGENGDEVGMTSSPRFEIQ